MDKKTMNNFTVETAPPLPETLDFIKTEAQQCSLEMYAKYRHHFMNVGNYNNEAAVFGDFYAGYCNRFGRSDDFIDWQKMNFFSKLKYAIRARVAGFMLAYLV